MPGGVRLIHLFQGRRPVSARAALMAAAALISSPVWAAEPPPLSVYAADPAITDVSMAPDGHAVAFISTQDGKRLLELLPAAAQEPRQVGLGNIDARQAHWIDADHLLIYHATIAEASDITPKQQILQAISYSESAHKSHVLLAKTPDTVPMVTGGLLSYGIYDGRRSIFIRGLTSGPKFALFAADVDTGRGYPVRAGSFDAESWVVAPDGAVMASKIFDASDRRSILSISSGPRSHRVDLGDAKTPFDPIGLGRTTGTVAVQRDGDVLEVSTETGAVSAPLQPPGAKVGAVYFNNATARLVAVGTTGDVPSYTFFDDGLRTAWARASAPFAAHNFSLISFSDDYSNLVVGTSDAKSAGAYYWVHLKTASAELIGETYPALTPETLASFSPFEFTTGDGFKLGGDVALPPGREPHGLPAVVLVENGPQNPQTGLGFDSLLQAIASRGYAVIRVRYRGSTGVQAPAGGEWGRRMQTDLSDAVAALARQGVIDAGRVCIAGSGYGGYAALAGVTLQKGVYRCAIGVEAYADLTNTARLPDTETRGPQWDRVAGWRPLLPQDGRSESALNAISPLAHAAQASAPILLIDQSEPDGLIPGNRRMNDALLRNGHPSELAVLDRKTQDMDRPAGRLAMMEKITAFLAKANPS